MRLISPGKMEIALDGREIFSVILISKFLRQHQPQRMHEKPEFSISGTSEEEGLLTRRSILLLREVMSMDKHRMERDIKVWMTTITLYIPIKRVLIANHPVMKSCSKKK